MPTKAEMQELEDNCTWEWTIQGGNNGYRVTGTNGNSIFMPAAGFYYNGSLYDAGFDGYYWLSSLNVIPIYAFNLGFSSGAVYVCGRTSYFG